MKKNLTDFFADLVTDARWSPTILGNLLSRPPGTWVSIPILCNGLKDAIKRYRSLLADGYTDTTVTWLPHPQQPNEAALVMFYQDEEMASSVALVTRAYLEKLAPRTRGMSQDSGASWIAGFQATGRPQP